MDGGTAICVLTETLASAALDVRHCSLDQAKPA